MQVKNAAARRIRLRRASGASPLADPATALAFAYSNI